MCVVIPYILEVKLFFFNTPFGKLCGRTNRSRSHIGGRPHRSFLFFSFLFSSGARFSRPFPSSTVKSNFVYPRHNCSPLVGHDVRENSSSRADASRFELTFHILSEGFRGDRLQTIFQNLNFVQRKVRCLMCCPAHPLKSSSDSTFSSWRVQAISNLFPPFREQPRST